jgi:diguanylate cyclase (GGDEF)-like protein/PAS domain S-box-containing protein
LQQPPAAPPLQTRAEQAYLEAFIESIPDMVWAKDISGVFLSCNPIVELFYGRPRDQIIGKTDADFVGPALAEHFREKDLAAMRAGTPQVNQEWLKFASDGKERLFETVKTPMRDAHGNILGILGVARDITERSRARIERKSLSRALKLIVKCNRAMMHASDEDALLRDICNLAVDEGGYAMAWVGFAMYDEEKSVVPAAWSAQGHTYLDRIRINWSDTPWGRGPLGTAIRTAKTVISQDYSADPKLQPWKARGAEHQFHSSIAIPLIKDGVAFAAMCIYSNETQAFGMQERQLLEEMTADLTFGIQTLRNQAQHEEAKRRLDHLAYHDTLTGTPNRLALRERYDQAVAATAAPAAGAIMLLDIDNFRAINDGLGHDFGDKVLVEVAARLQRHVHDAGVVCRHGGDEFAVLLTAAGDAAAIADMSHQLLEALAAPVHIDGYTVDTTVSAGVALYPRDGTRLEDLVMAADTALMKAKDSGKNDVLFFHPDMRSDDQEQLLLRAQLRNAARNGELVLHYQPKLDLRTHTIVGAEALIRWQHPQKGLLGPASFIPLAEKTGLIIPIGEWVLNTACRQLAAWKKAGLPLQSVSVNVAALQVRRGGLHRSVALALSGAGLCASDIELELTESAFLHDLPAATRLVRNMRLSGVKLSIDDFGTGYSSLSYLKTLRVDRLKIDQSFIKEIPGNAQMMAIVKTIIQLGRNLNLAITAEGVETAAQLCTLQELGCDEAQGYLIAQPLPAEIFAKLLSERRTIDFGAIAGPHPAKAPKPANYC